MSQSLTDQMDTLLKQATQPETFHSLRFERINPERNERRYYYIGWQPTLIDDGAVVRIYGRKNRFQRVHAVPY